MILLDRYDGGQRPFVGYLALPLRWLPDGARATRATVTVAPAVKADGSLDDEFTFTWGAPKSADGLRVADWGVTRTPDGPAPAREVDFHARRTLAAVGLTSTTKGVVSLQVDVGGMYVQIESSGAVLTGPGGSPYDVQVTKGLLPGLTVTKFRLTSMDDKAPVDFDSVTIRSLPANVSVRLGALPPFLVSTGDLAVPLTSPDFAAQLNAFLAANAATDGFHAVPFLVHSDAIARLMVDVAIEFVIERA